MDDLRDRIAKALRDKQKSNDSRPSVRAADAVMAVVGPEVEGLEGVVTDLGVVRLELQAEVERLHKELAKAESAIQGGLTHVGKVLAERDNLAVEKRLVRGELEKLRMTHTAVVAERDEAKQVLAEEIAAIAEERIATGRANVLELIHERDALKVQRDAKAEMLRRVRARHRVHRCKNGCPCEGEGDGRVCGYCQMPWPCPDREDLDRESAADALDLAKEMHRQRQRAEQAEARLEAARQALIRDGYFTAEQVGDDIAPRITERLAALDHPTDTTGETRG
ncbi:hypothetical protein [Streptomyces sp.]|uniref:hypothetical protein n=1 Tax=Streptomyces sp. TaxID=1931 RepID=UPI002F91DCA2